MIERILEFGKVGAHYVPERQWTEVVVWAPSHKSLRIKKTETNEFFDLMGPSERGYFSAQIKDLKVGDLYQIALEDGRVFPDPASRFQPQGVHGPSMVVDPLYSKSPRAFNTPSLFEWIIYELHVGTFTDEGTFAAVIPHLRRLKDLGVTTIEIMPVAPFSGQSNWGYDGVGSFAVQESYGGPHQLKELVDACHDHGLAVILDVVYNHVGPEGNYLSAFGPYFQSKYHTPWGEAINFDGPHSDEVKRYFLQSIWQWLEEFEFDGLRLDAIQTIFDTSAEPFLEMASVLTKEIAGRSGRSVYLIGETDENKPAVVQSPSSGGLGLDAHWADDLHHALHAYLTGETTGYYSDYGTFDHIARVFKKGVCYANDYSKYRQRTHGREYSEVDWRRLVVCLQNHDQVGNRMNGERLTQLVDTQEKVKLGAATVLLSPFLPMIFMGEEYGEDRPFQFFVSHLDPELLELVREGRKNEFKSFGWNQEPPVPGEPKTFERSKLDQSKISSPLGQAWQKYYSLLCSLSRQWRKEFCEGDVQVDKERKVLTMEAERVNCFFNFSSQKQRVSSSASARVLFYSAQPLETESNWQEEPENSADGHYELEPYCCLLVQTANGR